MKKITQKLVWSYFALISTTLPNIVFGFDSDTQTLAANSGAVDFFEVTCAKSNDSTIGDSDHLSFTLFENGGTPPAPQRLNATLTKSKLNAKIKDVLAGTNQSVTLKGGGNGAYTVTIDTQGTNLSIKTLQNYQLKYQCLNINKQPTTGTSTLVKQNVLSNTKTLANNKTAKYAINCAKNKITGNTDSLEMSVINNTPAQQTSSSNAEVSSTGTLSAQILSKNKVKNTIGTSIDLQNGNGIYQVMVNSPTNEAKSYHFEYSCQNKTNFPTPTSLTTLQDQ